MRDKLRWAPIQAFHLIRATARHARANGHLLKNTILTLEWAPAFARVTLFENYNDYIDC